MDNIRKIVDGRLEASKALPAAGAAASTDAIDIGTSSPENVELNVSVPATPNLVATKKITVTVEDSDDNQNFASIGYSFTVTGAAQGGGPAAVNQIRLPSSCREYVRVTAAVDAAGGDNTAVSVTAGLRF